MVADENSLSGGGRPPYVKPVLDALGRMQNREVLSVGEVKTEAISLLQDAFGSADASTSFGYACGCTGLLGEQTHYSDGFAMLLAMEQGMGVAVRPTDAETCSLIFKGEEAKWHFSADPEAELAGDFVWLRIVQSVAQMMRKKNSGLPNFEMAVVSGVPSSCFDAYMSALSVAVVRALNALRGAQGESAKELAPKMARLLKKSTSLPFSLAYPLASLVSDEAGFRLIDTATVEHLQVEPVEREEVGWALLDTGGGPSRDSNFHREQKELTDRAIRYLQEHGFEKMDSFRDLEHRDLQRAMDVLPSELKPIARHLVTENRRVQKIVKSIRKGDWQFFGALLLMSHASLSDVWDSTTPILDFAVDQAEELSMEGIVGACMTGRGGSVLIAGRPLSLPKGLEKIADSCEEQFGSRPDVLLL